MTPTAHLDDRSLVSIQLVMDARGICDDVATESREHVGRHAPVVLRGLAKQHVIALRDHDPEMPAATLLGRLHEHTCHIDREPRGAVARVLPHRIDHATQERGPALDQVCERRARQVYALALEDFLPSIQGQVVRRLLRDHVRDSPGPPTERGMD